MTAPYRMAMLLVTGLGAIYSFVRAEPIWRIYYDSGYSGTRPPPSFEEFLILAALGGILTLIFLLMVSSIVYRCYIGKK